MDSTDDNTIGPCDTIYSLGDVVHTLFAKAHTLELWFCLGRHDDLIQSLKSDKELYNPIYKEQLNELKDFLKNPDEHFDLFIQVFREYWDINNSFCRSHCDDCDYHTMQDFLIPIVSDLEYILERVPRHDYETMHEENKEFYHELNKYICKPERIERIAGQYGIEFFDYLDAIAV